MQTFHKFAHQVIKTKNQIPARLARLNKSKRAVRNQTNKNKRKSKKKRKL
jgi:hypothetical protein